MADFGIAEFAALASVAAAGATVYSVANAPKPPTPPKLPQQLQQKAPDTSALVSQRARQRAAAMGRASTLKTSPLGMVGTGGTPSGAGTATTLGGA